MTRPDQTRPDQTRPDQTSYLYDFILEWLDSEALFIFCTIFLNLTASKVTYKFLFTIPSELLILLCDVAITSFTVIAIDVVIYLLLHRHTLLLKAAKFLLLAASICMFMVDAFTLYNFAMPFNMIMLDTILMTNFHEAWEFSQMYLLSPGVWVWFGALALSMLVVFALFRVVLRWKRLILACYVLGFCLGVFASARELYTGRGNSRIVESIALCRMISMYSASYEGKQAYNQMLKASPQSVIITKNEGSIPFVVFVLGESACRDHMQLYGYGLDTTPKLRELQEQGRLYVFDDVITSHAGTASSMQKIFTFYRYGSLGNWYEYTDIFRIIKAAGYRTVWLSNQENSSSWRIAGFLFKDCDKYLFTEKFKNSGYRGTSYDGALLPMLDDELASEGGKRFIMLHLMGSHFHYNKRYPHEYAHFTSDQEQGSSESHRALRAEYDNSILYSDFIITEIIRRFTDMNAIVIYVSDHGEDVYDEYSTKFVGHSEGMKSSYMIEVPMIIWCSQKFSDTYPELTQRIASSVHRPYMTDDIIYTILDIMSIETDEYVPSRSVINPDFDASRPRIYADYLYTKEGGLREVH